MLRWISLVEGEAVLRGERLASAMNTRNLIRAARVAVFVTAARIVSGWFGLAGVVGLSLSTDARWSAWRITLETQAIGIAFLLLGTVRAWGDFDHGSPMTWAFVGSLVAGLVAISGSYVRVEGQRRDGA